MSFYHLKICGKSRLLKPKQLTEFCSQIAVMVGSGITFSKAVGILQTGMEDECLREVYHELEGKMEQGNSISDAMKQLGIFPEMMVNMFHAGEMSGRLSDMSKKLADYYRKEHQMISRIQNAMLYPEILSIMSLASVLVIFLVIMPIMEPFFEGLKLPMITRFLMAFSHFIQKKWYWVAVGAILIYMLRRVLLRNYKVLLWRDRKKLRLPLVARQLRMIYTARFARTMSSLYTSGLPMIESMEIAGKVIGNKYVEAQFSEAIAGIREGEMLSHAIKSVEGFDRRLSPVIFVGEETGKLDDMLSGIADSYEYEASLAIDRLISLIEPTMILFMGVIIGLILIGIMVPVWNMYGNVV